MHISSIKTRRKALTKLYNHEICFCHKLKGNIVISCACANACSPLFTEETRGCNVLEMHTVHKVCRKKRSQTKITASLQLKWILHRTILLRHMQRRCCIRRGVSAGAKKLLRYKRYYVISDFAVSDSFFCDTKKDFGREQKNSFAISGTSLYLTLLYPALTVLSDDEAVFAIGVWQLCQTSFGLCSVTFRV